MLLKSNNSYGKTKIINEKKIIKSFKKTKTKYCILRFFNVSGCLRKYKIGEFHSPETHLIPIIINSFLKKFQFMEINTKHQMGRVLEIIFILMTY
jgi:UDP-glucose 4-epimerase